MRKWLRRIRGAMGMGLTWALAWFGAGLVLLLVIGPNAADVPFPLFFGFLGFIAGMTFSAILALAERRRTFEQMSLPRFALWGGAEGVLLAAAMALGLGAGALLVLGPIFAVAGAGCASGSLLLARTADRGAIGAGSDAGRLPRR